MLRLILREAWECVVYIGFTSPLAPCMGYEEYEWLTRHIRGIEPPDPVAPSSSPPPGHPERAAAHMPPDEAERWLWSQFSDRAGTPDHEG